MPPAGVKSNRANLTKTSFDEIPSTFMSKTSPSGLSTSFNTNWKSGDWNI